MCNINNVPSWCITSISVRTIYGKKYPFVALIEYTLGEKKKISKIGLRLNKKGEIIPTIRLSRLLFHKIAKAYGELLEGGQKQDSWAEAFYKKYKMQINEYEEKILDGLSDP